VEERDAIKLSHFDNLFNTNVFLYPIQTYIHIYTPYGIPIVAHNRTYCVLPLETTRQEHDANIFCPNVVVSCALWPCKHDLARVRKLLESPVLPSTPPLPLSSA